MGYFTHRNLNNLLYTFTMLREFLSISFGFRKSMIFYVIWLNIAKRFVEHSTLSSYGSPCLYNSKHDPMSALL